MKRLFYIMIAATMVLSSCTIESSGNGKLDGMWRLQRVDSLKTGGSRDLTGANIFWCVQHKLMEFTGGKTGDYYMRFDNGSDHLRLFSPYSAKGHEEEGKGGDFPVTDATELHEYGIPQTETSFYKDKLTGSEMILSTDSLRLFLKKF